MVTVRSDGRVKLQPLVSKENKCWLQHYVLDCHTDAGHFIDQLLTSLRTGQIILPSNFLEENENAENND